MPQNTARERRLNSAQDRLLRTVQIAGAIDALESRPHERRMDERRMSIEAGRMDIATRQLALEESKTAAAVTAKTDEMEWERRTNDDFIALSSALENFDPSTRTSREDYQALVSRFPMAARNPHFQQRLEYMESRISSHTEEVDKIEAGYLVSPVYDDSGRYDRIATMKKVHEAEAAATVDFEGLPPTARLDVRSLAAGGVGHAAAVRMVFDSERARQLVDFGLRNNLLESADEDRLVREVNGVKVYDYDRVESFIGRDRIDEAMNRRRAVEGEAAAAQAGREDLKILTDIYKELPDPEVPDGTSQKERLGSTLMRLGIDVSAAATESGRAAVVPEAADRAQAAGQRADETRGELRDATTGAGASPSDIADSVLGTGDQ